MSSASASPSVLPVYPLTKDAPSMRKPCCSRTHTFLGQKGALEHIPSSYFLVVDYVILIPAGGRWRPLSSDTYGPCLFGEFTVFDDQGTWTAHCASHVSQFALLARKRGGDTGS